MSVERLAVRGGVDSAAPTVHEYTLINKSDTQAAREKHEMIGAVTGAVAARLELHDTVKNTSICTLPEI